MPEETLTWASKKSTKYDKNTPRVPESTEDYLRARWVKTMFDRYVDYWRPETDRILRNQRMMWGVNFGQWPSYVVEKLRSEGRRAPTLNIIARKIEQQVGSYMSNGFDMGYAPVNGKVDSMSLSLADMRISDEHNCRWKVPERVALRDMFTQVGYESMIITDKYNDDGNISWEVKNPRNILIDTSWKDYDPDNIDNWFEHGMFTVKQIKEIWHTKSEKIDEIREREENTGMDLGTYMGGVQAYPDTEQKWGDRHQVIAYHWVKKETRYWEYDLQNRCSFPETGFPAGSAADRDLKTEYIKMMGLGPNDITIRRQTKRQKQVEVVCPSLDIELFLARGKDKIQTNNCNIYPLGNGYNGQFKGTVDELYDIQIEYNKGVMNISDIQLRAARGGFIMDRALTGGDSAVEAEIEREWNNPAARIWVDEGSTADLGQHGGIIRLSDGQVPTDVFARNDRLLDLSDWFSTSPAAAEARQDTSNQSGKLFQSKYQVSLIGQKHGMEIYEAHKAAKTAAYAKQAKITYAGWPRIFTKIGGKESFTINERMETIDEFGEAQRYTKDDISLLPEQLVNIYPSQNGANIRNDLRGQYTDALQLFTDPLDRLGRLVVQKSLFKTYEMPDESKEEIARAFDLMTTNAAMQEALINLSLRGKLQSASAPPEAAMPGQEAPVGMGGQSAEAPPQQMAPGEPTEEEAIQGTPFEEELTPSPVGGIV